MFRCTAYRRQQQHTGDSNSIQETAYRRQQQHTGNSIQETATAYRGMGHSRSTPVNI